MQGKYSINSTSNLRYCTKAQAQEAHTVGMYKKNTLINKIEHEIHIK